MSDEADNRKPDGSAWKAHMEGLSARNDAARKAGRQERDEHERAQALSRRAADMRQTAELRKRAKKDTGSAALLRDGERQ